MLIFFRFTLAYGLPHTELRCEMVAQMCGVTA